MYIVLGASGQVGLAVVKELLKRGERVRGIAHSKEKTASIENLGAESVAADGFDIDSLVAAFSGGDTVFLITPETGKSEDLIAETTQLLNNYKKAIEQTGIKKIVGLSSIGAHLGKGSGNLEMSYLLEHAFAELPIPQVFIRPAYYLSNWMLYLQMIKDTGILLTFYPVDEGIDMIAPEDVAGYAAEILVQETSGKTIYEIEGAAKYTSADVANAFGEALEKPVKAEQIPKGNWAQTLKKAGFTDDGAENFMKMTNLVIQGKTAPEQTGTFTLRGTTTLKEYIGNAVKGAI